ncbi:toxin biosynthesis ketoreductase [Aspergillus sclerotioniger CBS 115572]|uniref:Toxin biosynthesis ketoreductase n=1 Tax=Aspergillus sclerotioniger CBS 115572 TaxID=1450535 RepID=A0A317WZZ2_9EURO|nr:toxin biosynthesis ketoreductase [Aspergillus sclerotioniger CBS 115572]PWY91933.1 toxin biosynthesis ketoreductase [Aspergillus sclerotioniger CBS 115572]
MASPTIYLITGANKGIGLALTQTLLFRPNTTVIATVRNPATAALHTLPTSPSSSLIILALDVQSPTDTTDAIHTLKTTHSITHIDTVIANAGYYNDAEYRIDNVPLSNVQLHFDVNTLGVIRLFQGVYGLLRNSFKPMFITVSSFLGSIGGLSMEYFPGGAYGLSKAGVNWATRKMHIENEGMVCFSVHPGFVKTYMGDACAKSLGLEQAFTEPQDCADSLIKLFDGATRETVGGRFVNYKGEEVPF